MVIATKCKEPKFGDKETYCTISVGGCPGIYIAETILRSQTTTMPMPIGTMYFRFLERYQTIDVLNVMVAEFYRRRGVAKGMIDYLLACYPNVDRVVSDAGSDSGIPWMKALGFIDTGRRWEFRRQKTAKKKTK